MAEQTQQNPSEQSDPEAEAQNAAAEDQQDSQQESQQESGKKSALNTRNFSDFAKAWEGRGSDDKKKNTGAKPPKEEPQPDGGDDGKKAEGADGESNEGEPASDDSEKTEQDGKESGKSSKKSTSKGKVSSGVSKRLSVLTNRNRDQSEEILRLKAELAAAKGGAPAPESKDSTPAPESGKDPGSEVPESGYQPYPDMEDFVLATDDAKTREAGMAKFDAAVHNWVHGQRYEEGPHKKPASEASGDSGSQPKTEDAPGDGKKAASPRAQLAGQALRELIEEITDENDDFDETAQKFHDGVFDENGKLPMTIEMAEHIVGIDDNEHARNVIESIIARPRKAALVADMPPNEQAEGLDLMAKAWAKNRAKKAAPENKPKTPKEEIPVVETLPSFPGGTNDLKKLGSKDFREASEVLKERFGNIR